MNLSTTPSNLVLVSGRRGCGKTSVVKALTSDCLPRNVVTLSSYSEDYTPNPETVKEFLSDPFGYCANLDKSMTEDESYALVFDDVIEMNHRQAYKLDGGNNAFAALLKLRRVSNIKRRRLCIIIAVQLLPNLSAYVRNEFDAFMFHRLNANHNERKFYSHARPPKDLANYRTMSGGCIDWWMTKNTSYDLNGYVFVRHHSLDGKVYATQLEQVDMKFSMEPTEDPETDNDNIITVNVNLELRIDTVNKKVVGVTLDN